MLVKRRFWAGHCFLLPTSRGVALQVPCVPCSHRPCVTLSRMSTHLKRGYSRLANEENGDTANKDGRSAKRPLWSCGRDLAGGCWGRCYNGCCHHAAACRRTQARRCVMRPNSSCLAGGDMKRRSGHASRYLGSMESRRDERCPRVWTWQGLGPPPRGCQREGGVALA